MTFHLPCAPAALYGEWLRWLPSWRSDFAFDVLRDTRFHLGTSGPLEVYYGPFDDVNPAARVVLVGITPGRRETALAYHVAREALCQGLGGSEIARQVKTTASFGGPTRGHLIAMLDGIGVPTALGLATTALLFTPHYAPLLHATAAVRYPVQRRGQDYAGTAPRLARLPELLQFVERYLAPELTLLDRALVVPLGQSVEEVLRLLVARGTLDSRRCLFGFPHPSGRNVARAVQFATRQPTLCRQVVTWHSAYA